MEKTAVTYNYLMSVMGAIFRAMGKVRAGLAKPLPALPPLLQLRGSYAESPGWYMVQASEFAPEPLTVKNLRVRDTYASPRIARALLDLLATEKWLDKRGNAYHLTDGGLEILQTMTDRRNQLLTPLNALPEEMVRLEQLLRRLIEASLQALVPPGAWCLAHSRNRAPQEDEPALHHILSYMADFNAFRDDAHMAAWQPLEIGGIAWESFTKVLDEHANTTVSLYDQLAYRGYAIEEFAAVLDELVGRGWLAWQDEGKVTATDAGTAVRAEVEAKTDHYFFAPWTTLSSDEEAELARLLEAFKVNLEAFASA